MITYNVRIPTTAQVRALESTWIKSCHPNWGAVLMEQAGAAAARVAHSLCPPGGSVVVFCGRGNNGGDGLVVARHLMRFNVPVSVYMVDSGSPKEADPQSESAINKRILQSLGAQIHHVSAETLDTAREAIFLSDLIVDALLGTGLDRKVEGIYAELVTLINDSGLPVLAIDIPSGINSDTGQVMGCAVEADATVTFGNLKAGLLHYPGAAHAGAISVVDIGLPSYSDLPPFMASKSAELNEPQWWLVHHNQVADWLPARPQDSHKGSFGRLLCIAGSAGMTGSSMLASHSALRSGLGLCVLATAKSIIRNLPAGEVIYHALPETADGTLALGAFEELQSQIELADAILLGPGLTTNSETVKLVQKLAASITKPCIVDADGLNAIAESFGDKGSGIKFSAPQNFVLTPHPKELSRLLGTSVAEIQADRIAAGQAAVKKFGCNVIVKGAHTVIATADGQSYIVTAGNAGMATAGAGDVLSGIIGALLAQHVPPSEAAVAGAYLHGAAGDLAAEKLGEDGMIAGDITQALPAVLSSMRAGTFEGTYIEHEAVF